MSAPTVTRNADGSLTLHEPVDCDDPVEVSLELLRELVAASSLVSQMRFLVRENPRAGVSHTGDTQ